MKYKIRFLTTFLFVSLVCACICIPALAEEGDPTISLDDYSTADIDSVSGSSVLPESTPEVTAEPTEEPESSDGEAVTGTAVVRAEKPTEKPADNVSPDDPVTVVSAPEPTPETGGTDGASSTASPTRGDGIAVRALGDGEKKIIPSAKVTLPSDILSGSAYITVGGILFSEPEIKYQDVGISDEIYERELKGNIRYVLRKDGSSANINVDFGGRVPLMDGTYSVYLALIYPDKSIYCGLDTDVATGLMNTGKSLTVNWYSPGGSVAKIESVPGVPKVDKDNKKWYQSYTISPTDNFQLINAEKNPDDSFTGVFTLSAEQKYAMVNGVEKQLYFAYKNPDDADHGWVATTLEGKYGPLNIDTVKPAATLTFPDSQETGTRHVTTKDSITLRYGLSDTATGASGASGVDSVEYKLANAGESGSDIDAAVYDAVTGIKSGSVKDMKGDGREVQEFAVENLTGFSNGDPVYVYSKITDVAGNSHYYSELFGYVDEGAPKFWSANEELNAVIENDSDDWTGVIMFSNDQCVIRARDYNLKKVTLNGATQTIASERDSEGYLYAEISMDRPAEYQEYVIVATDTDDKTNTLNLRLVHAEYTVPEWEQIDFGAVEYGYEPAAADDSYIGLEETEYKTNEKGERIVGKYGDLLSVELSADAELSFSYGTVKSEQYFGCKVETITTSSRSALLRLYAAPEAKLSAAGRDYLGRMLVSTDKVTVAPPQSTLWGRAAVLGDENIPFTSKLFHITVNPAPLVLTYANGRSIRSTETGSVELYHTRPGALSPGDPADWTDRLSIAGGLKYDDTEKALRNDPRYQAPTILDVRAEEAGILDDGYVIGSGRLYFSIDEGEAATNYYYPQTESASGSAVIVTGLVRCVRSSFARTRGSEIGSYYVTGQEGSPNWYTSDVTIGPEKGFLIMDAGQGACQYDYTTGEVYITDKDHKEYDREIPIDKQFSKKSITVSKEAAAGKGVVQFFYQYDEDTGVVSDLMYETVIIDKSRPGYAWDASVGETPLAEFPYFRLYDKIGREFFTLADATITINKNDPLMLYSVADKESGIDSIKYLISADENMTVAKLKNQMGWREFNTADGNYYLTGVDRTSGYLYVRLTNHAGLSTFLYLDEKVEYTAKDEDRIILPATLNLPSVTYGYQYVETTPVEWTDTSPDGKYLTLDEVLIEGGDKAVFSLDHSSASGAWYITPSVGLSAGTYRSTLVLKFSDGRTRNVPLVFTVNKKALAVSYSPSQTTYYKGETIYDTGHITVVGFVPGEGRMDSADGTVKMAADYVDPKITIPRIASQTVWVEPYGGSARNYSFEYYGFYLNVIKRIPQPGEHYTVKMQETSNGWSTSRIVIYSGTGDGSGKRYRLSLYEDGRDPQDSIELTEDTANGSLTFYVVDPDTGEIMGPEVFKYKIDNYPPVIDGAKNGETFVTNLKQLFVTDANLATVSVNGVNQSITGQRCVVTLVPSTPTEEFLIVATDEAGLQTTRTVYLRQPDGATEKPKATETPRPTEGPLPTAAPMPTLEPVEPSEDPAPPKGEVIPDIQLLDGAPDTYISSSDNQLIKILLTSAERDAVKKGSDFRYRLLVRDISTEVSQSDKEKVFSVLGDYTVAQYLNVSLWKRVGSGTETQVMKTEKPLSVTFAAPSGLPGGAKNYRFAVVRVTPDGTDVLEDCDEVPSEVTVMTNRFDAVYALAYRKAPKKSNNDASDEEDTPDSSKKDDTSVRVELSSPEAGDHAPLIPTAVAFGVSLIGMIVVAVLRRRQ